MSAATYTPRTGAGSSGAGGASKLRRPATASAKTNTAATKAGAVKYEGVKAGISNLKRPGSARPGLKRKMPADYKKDGKTVLEETGELLSYC